MSHLHSEDTRYLPGPPSRPFSARDDRDGRMYDDNSPSRSRSPGDPSRTPPRGPAADRRHEYPRDHSGSGSRYLSRDRDDFRRRPSRSPPRRSRGGYRDRDREGYKSRSRSRSYSRSRSPRRDRPHYGQESREVMMDGLPVDMTEEDISKELKDFYNIEGLEEVRVIRDRQTKLSRQLGFLRFKTLGSSRSFVERNFPSIYLCGPNAQDDRGSKVRIAYSREREDRARARAEADWTCQLCSIVNYSTRQKCFRCQAPRPDAGPTGPPGIAAPRVFNNGDNDAAPENQPSQFLLFRGLETSVNEELLAKGVAKLYRPSNSDSGSGTQKKGAKVASTTGDSNLGARDGSIRRILLVRDRRSNESWRYGFAEFATIQDAQAAIVRLHSFEKFTISSKPVMVSYIHAGVFVPVMNPNASTEKFTFSPLNNPALKLMYWDEDAYVNELMVSSESETQQAPKTERPTGQTDSKAKDATDKAKKRKADAASAASGAKKMAMPSHLQFWSNRHAELHGIQKKEPDDKAPADLSSTLDTAAAPPRQSFADPNRNCCYLCMRQFKAMAEVNRHERLSQLHRSNLQKDELVARGMNKLIKHGIIPAPPEYRDRARERRQAFGRGRATANKPAPAPAPEREPSPSAETTSKGASLLSKMGWFAGTGLGAQGTGMTAPISTEVYAQGVGLGAQGGKLGDASEEAARNTRGRYDEFLEKTRQTARQRYEQMDRAKER
ncbi:Putative Rna-binding protein [Aspergillus calidoustus]|uniref:Putative Rna-binding protein n=1 Tax=Aspergillus calidoustus TaxID=454130 RepID=A0A0U4ZEA7_ASPCI|nr:Putative Rna-binding protein [Aspergillus calidoustus]